MASSNSAGTGRLTSAPPKPIIGAMILYVGNLPAEATETQLRDLFGAHGEVAAVRLAYHHRSGEFLRYARVEMATEESAEKAMAQLDGHLLECRPLKVMPAFIPPDIPEGFEVE